MVLYSANIFEDIRTRTNQDLAVLTWNVIGSFNPELKKSLEEALSPFLSTIKK